MTECRDPGLPPMMDGQTARRVLRLAQLHDRRVAQNEADLPKAKTRESGRHSQVRADIQEETCSHTTDVCTRKGGGIRVLQIRHARNSQFGQTSRDERNDGLSGPRRPGSVTASFVSASHADWTNFRANPCIETNFGTLAALGVDVPAMIGKHPGSMCIVCICA